MDNLLVTQKTIIRKTLSSYITVAVLLLIFLLFSFFTGNQLASDYTLLLIFIAVIVAAAVTFFWVDFITCIKAYKTLNKIYVITEIVLTDICKRKFYCIFTGGIGVSNRKKNSIIPALKKKLLHSPMQVSCYKGTNIIRELKLDMYKHNGDLR